MHELLAQTWRVVLSAFEQAALFLASSLGHRAEAISLAAIALILSFAFARQLGKAVDTPYRQLSGAKLKNTQDAEKRVARLKKLRRHRWRFALWLFAQWMSVGFFAFVVPSALLALGIYYYGWFLPQREALVAELGCNYWSTAQPTARMLFMFVTSQFSMGFGHSLDMLTSNGSTVSQNATFNPANGFVGLVLIAYRYFIGGFATIFLRFFWKMVVVFRAVTPEETQLVSTH